MSLLFEACVDTIEAALSAEAAGAARVEVCDFRGDGGLTPAPALIRECRIRLGIPVCALVRPRAGSFVHDAAAADATLADVAIMRDAGAHAVVAGGLTAHGEVDVVLTERVMEAAGDLPVVFHRAFDRAHDREAALETLIRLGIGRVLTSGGAPTAPEGMAALGALVRRSAGRITILAGGGVTPEAVGPLVRGAGVTEIHASAPPDGAKARAIIAALRSAAPPDVDPALR